MERIYKQFYISPDGADKNPGTAEKPFKTFDAAKAAVANCNKDMTGNIIVNVLPGNYDIEKTIVLDDSISGKNGYNVIFRGTDKANKPILNGGKKVTGWKKCKKGELWCAPLDVEAMRTLYINGLPALRAIGNYLYTPIEDYKEEGSQNIADGIVVSAENFRADYEHPEELELVWPLLWTLQRTPVEKMIKKDDKVIFILKQPCFNYGLTKDAVFTNPGTGAKGEKKFYLENAKELLDKPGKFYWSKTEKVVYYWPYPQENMETADVYTCQTEGIIKLAGDNKFKKVKNVIVDNLEICYGGWNEVTNEGLITTQADVCVNKLNGYVEREGKYIPAQVEINRAENVHFRNCKIHSIGSTGICIADAVKNSTVTGNRLTDISGTGIMVDHWDHRQDTMPVQMERCENLVIANNVIHRAACEFKGHTGMTIFFPKNTVVCHNDIKNTPYSGVSYGWGWGGQHVVDANSNRVEYNRIEDVTDVVHDGGHIYTLDTLNGIIQGNYLITAGEYRGGVYLDSGTRDLIIRDNVMQDCEQWLFARAFVGLERITAYNNYFEQGSYSERDYVQVTDYNNIEAPVDENGNTLWPLEAQKIIDFAGLEDEYKYLLEDTELPEWRVDVHDFQPQSEFANEKNTWTNCANYIDGAGEASAYHTKSGKVPQATSNHYGTYMNDIDDGDWFKYDVYVNKDGEYDVEMKCAQREEVPTVTAKVTVNIDGTDVIVAKELPDNGFYIDEWWRKAKPYPAVNLGKVNLTKGSHTVKIMFVDNSPSYESFRFYNESVLGDLVYQEGI